MKYYAVERSHLGTLNKVFLENIKTQKLFKKRKISDRIVLKNFQNSKNSNQVILL